jgi:acetyltransferase-like isoleucine patch superfamily enzyme
VGISDPELAFDEQASALLPWLEKSPAQLEGQKAIKALLERKAGAKFGRDSYVAPGAKVFTDSLTLGERSWIASGAIVRGHVRIGPDTSVNANAHIAGIVRIGRGCRIASNAAIFGFNHGFERSDVMICQQPTSSEGITIQDDVWIGANAVIVDGVEIGAHCIVGGGAVVTKSFAPYQIIGGNPARVIAERNQQVAPALEAPSRDPSRRVRDMLFDQDPYKDPVYVLPEDLQGWGSSDPIFKTIIDAAKPNLIVEIGTWKGASAVHMAALCKAIGLPCEIVCVDTWLGNWQHWSRRDGIGSRSDLRLVSGYPMLYFQFLSNVLAQGHNDIITPLPLPSVAAVKLFEHHGLKPDVIYVDGDHEYESVSTDLRLWSAVLASQGVIFGDDCDWPGVKRAVSEFADTGRWDLQLIGNKFCLRSK